MKNPAKEPVIMIQQTISQQDIPVTQILKEMINHKNLNNYSKRVIIKIIKDKVILVFVYRLQP
ncbi:hypothetical protein TTHERM_000823373 (macronuclear) [Tetrahymena thermophila SB210]|uniref:Uncharacterized protein n=1 Tax=Tetrahymena thermophila (strain SB210) TaxID=312017 RepID=W7WYN0_TETTS|nr:hypothetical protein TTHERM_000823373 [Tetrahymena thermophila SB210]EWS72000.1 hypothetical protein TTHERM_000823373 [Tetrahymena thermophila SB210]|eukprot:XP_012655456.1 hypothetical protein TTHERM_000823373 [Tetrahymena thermophila SB210]